MFNLEQSQTTKSCGESIQYTYKIYVYSYYNRHAIIIYVTFGWILQNSAKTIGMYTAKTLMLRLDINIGGHGNNLGSIPNQRGNEMRWDSNSIVWTSLDWSFELCGLIPQEWRSVLGEGISSYNPISGNGVSDSKS